MCVERGMRVAAFVRPRQREVGDRTSQALFISRGEQGLRVFTDESSA
jgi:hypothetical protein